MTNHVSRFATFAGWPRLQITNRTIPESYWLFSLTMRHPNPGPRDLSEVHANGSEWSDTINRLRDYVDRWHEDHDDVR